MTTVIELQQKSAELRHAALRFQASSQKIRATVANVNQIVTDLAHLGYESPAAAQWMAHYHSEQSWITGWADTLLHFAQRLNEAADQIDKAIAELNHHPAPAHAHTSSSAQVSDTNAVAAPIPAPPHTLTSQHPSLLKSLEDLYTKVKSDILTDIHNASLPPATDYLSIFNRSRLEQSVVDQQTLALKQATLANLQAQRDSAAQSLHMLMEHSATDQNARLLTLAGGTEEQLRVLNLRILGTSTDIDRLKTEAATIQQRLDLLRPQPGANIELIHTMEQGPSPGWLQNNTFDCVRYIVSKMSVPPAIARDAYLWPDQPALLHQYGINVGNVPMPGAVLVLDRTHPYADPVHGHLMYVERVDDNGSVWITDNTHPNPVQLSSLTNQTSGSNMEYLYFPWQTHA